MRKSRALCRSAQFFGRNRMNLDGPSCPFCRNISRANSYQVQEPELVTWKIPLDAPSSNSRIAQLRSRVKVGDPRWSFTTRSSFPARPGAEWPRQNFSRGIRKARPCERSDGPPPILGVRSPLEVSIGHRCSAGRGVLLGYKALARRRRIHNPCSSGPAGP